MPIPVTPETFNKLRIKLNLSIKSVAKEMKGKVHFNTLYTFEGGNRVSEETLFYIAKWMESKQ